MSSLYRETMEQIEPAQSFSQSARRRLQAGSAPARPRRRPSVLAVTAAALAAVILLTGSAFAVSGLIRQNQFYLYTSSEALHKALPKDEITPYGIVNLQRDRVDDWMSGEEYLTARRAFLEERWPELVISESQEIFSDEAGGAEDLWIRRIRGRNRVGTYTLYLGNSLMDLYRLQDQVTVDLSCLEAAYSPEPGCAMLMIREGEQPGIELSGAYRTPEGGAVLVSVTYALWAAEFGNEYVLADAYKFQRKAHTADGTEVTCYGVENRSFSSAIFARGAFHVTGFDTDGTEQKLLKQIDLGTLPTVFSEPTD